MTQCQSSLMLSTKSELLSLLELISFRRLCDVLLDGGMPAFVEAGLLLCPLYVRCLGPACTPGMLLGSARCSLSAGIRLVALPASHR